MFMGFTSCLSKISFPPIWSRPDVQHSGDRLSTHASPQNSLVANLLAQRRIAAKILALDSQVGWA
ncbi:hypothetical protein I3842_10G109500 [Carya illinoinensis]|uniref:Uncharacterized protein n=1 Tax=Carya illinoinensis TaxID=32201 RepID=A0A922DWR4_CARIL|nr:hypothetical protein I3842_10G109500 [Carya illinoinensis]